MKRLLALMALSLLSTSALAQRCNFRTETEGHVESKILVLFRGGIVAMGGHFGIKDGEAYLRTRYNSQFKGRASFSADTPLTLRLADGKEVALPVVADTEAKLAVIGIALGNRTAQPMFALTREQLAMLAESPVVGLTMRFRADGALQSDDREVKQGHSESIRDTVRCLPLEKLAD
jgi:hypothetical protein